MARRCKGCLKFQSTDSFYCHGCQQVKRKYHVNPEDIHKLLIDQGGKCGICGTPPKSTRKLAVDHNPQNGMVRGLLCTRCNLGLGYLHSTQLLKEAVKYLDQPYPDLTYISPIVRVDVPKNLVETIFNDSSIIGLREKARILASQSGLTEAAALSRLRRFDSSRVTSVLSNQCSKSSDSDLND